MSSLKYIFVIQGNALVRIPTPMENNEAEKPSAEQYFTEPDKETGGVQELTSKTTEPKQRNKRNKTSRG